MGWDLVRFVLLPGQGVDDSQSGHRTLVRRFDDQDRGLGGWAGKLGALCLAAGPAPRHQVRRSPRLQTCQPTHSAFQCSTAVKIQPQPSSTVNTRTMTSWPGSPARPSSATRRLTPRHSARVWQKIGSRRSFPSATGLRRFALLERGVDPADRFLTPLLERKISTTAKSTNGAPPCQRRSKNRPRGGVKVYHFGTVRSLSPKSTGGSRARLGRPIIGQRPWRAWEGPVGPRGQADGARSA